MPITSNPPTTSRSGPFAYSVPMVVEQGTASDIEVQAREIIRMNARLQEMMAADTGQSVERLGHDINRDYWMSAAEAKDYGIVDLIVGQTDATDAADKAEAAVKDTPDINTRSANGRH
jgi:Clp protease